MSSIIFISFDIRKDEYPSMSYSIASMVAVLRKENHIVSHYSVDLQHSLEEKISKQSISEIITQKLEINMDYFKKFEFIAISLTSWTIEYCHIFFDVLKNYNGKVILGGYEVTSRSEENLLLAFPRVDYFIKGYAEKALKDILSGCNQNGNKVFFGKIESNDMVSPYLTKVLSTTSKKLHWETKRGCKFKCGFCEWGNATIKVIDLDYERLTNEITLFKESCIDEINILDGTFNIGAFYIDIFKMLLEIKDVKITCHARFETLSNQDGLQFLELCRNAGKRVHLEFGLQTIHKNEMNTIGRQNDIDKIKQALSLLKLYEIDYEVSIIYAIPGQTVESFIDTIEFLIDQGCKNIKAYPLSIPKNSMMESKKAEWNVVEGKNRYNVLSVISAYSFSLEQRADMDRIVERLNKGELFKDIDTIPSNFVSNSLINKRELTPYQWEITSVEKSSLTQDLIDRIHFDYITPTISDIHEQDFRQGMFAIGERMKEWDNNSILENINGILSGEISLKLDRWELPNVDIDSNEENNKLLIKINPHIIPQKYNCKVRISKSNNIYVYREIQKIPY